MPITACPIATARLPVRNIHVPPVVREHLRATERDACVARIKTLLAERNAILVAHYYTDPEIQRLADETGGHVSDSLDMARFGLEHPATTLIVAGVRFMGETAKILSPEKTVLMPDLGAECSLDLGCPAAEFVAFCDAHPEHTVMVYANTSAAVKARADWVVTSGIALDLVRHVASQGKPILWAPDRYLGDYIRNETGADMLLWNAACVVHEEFKGAELGELRLQHPAALVLVHPESPPQVIALADVVGSTSQLIAAVRQRPEREFIVATDAGIFHKMQQAAPDKRLLPAPTHGHSATCRCCAYCPWMAMNGLAKIAHVLETGENEIHLDPALCTRARLPIARLLAFAQARRTEVLGNNDA